MSVISGAVWRYEQGIGPLSRIERCLVGAILDDKHLRLCCSGLKTKHFSDPSVGAAYDALTSIKHPTIDLVDLELIRRKVPVPAGFSSWTEALYLMATDGKFSEDEVVKEYVRAIVDGYAKRKLEGTPRVGA